MKIDREHLNKIEVSLFRNVMSNDQPEQIPLIKLLERIGSNYYAGIIKELRGLEEKQYKEEKRRRLPAFTLSVKCKHRKGYKGDPAGEIKYTADKIEKYNPVIQIDIDAQNNPDLDIQAVRNKFNEIPFIWFYFLSPRGNGIKAGFLHDSTDWKTHKEAFTQISDYLKNNCSLNITIDELVSNPFSLFNVSHDPDLVLKPADQIEFFPVKKNPVSAAGSLTEASLEEMKRGSGFKEVKTNYTGKAELIKGLTTMINKSVPGNRHNTRIISGTIAGGYIAGENLTQDEIIHSLQGVIFDNTDNPKQAIKDFTAGIEYGKRKPLKFDKIKKNSAAQSTHPAQGNNSAGETATPPEPVEKTALTFIQRKQRFYFNEITGREEIYSLNDEYIKPLEDRDFNSYIIKLKESGIKISITGLKTVLQSDIIPVKNELKEYFESCRIKFKSAALDYSPFEKLTGCIEFDQDESRYIFDTYFEKWLLWSLENLFRERHFIYGGNPMMMIFHSVQHQKGKSTFFRELLPEYLRNKYYYEGDIHPESKDDKLNIATKFIYNLDEMGDYVKKDLSLLKKIITLPDFSQRLPYDKFSGERKRLCSFCGTSNNDQILTDITGNRRFIIIGVNSLFSGINYLRKERELLWGEMYDRYLSGYDFTLSNDDTNFLNQYSKPFEVTVNEKYLIEEYFEPVDAELTKFNSKKGDNTGEGNFWQAEAVLNFFLNHEKTREIAKKTTSQKFGISLSSLGYQKIQRRFGGAPLWGYSIKVKDDNKPRLDINNQQQFPLN